MKNGIQILLIKQEINLFKKWILRFLKPGRRGSAVFVSGKRPSASHLLGSLILAHWTTHPANPTTPSTHSPPCGRDCRSSVTDYSDVSYTHTHIRVSRISFGWRGGAPSKRGVQGVSGKFLKIICIIYKNFRHP